MGSKKPKLQHLAGASWEGATERLYDLFEQHRLVGQMRLAIIAAVRQSLGLEEFYDPDTSEAILEAIMESERIVGFASPDIIIGKLNRAVNGSVVPQEAQV